METKHLFSHNLNGITLTIYSESLEGANALLKKIVIDTAHWKHYK